MKSMAYCPEKFPVSTFVDDREIDLLAAGHPFISMAFLLLHGKKKRKEEISSEFLVPDYTAICPRFQLMSKEQLRSRCMA